MVTPSDQITIGILALQGAFDLHEKIIEFLDTTSGKKLVSKKIKKVSDLKEIDGIILPGGESTVMAKLLDSSGVGSELSKMIKSGLPNFGTCAGLILQSQYFSCINCDIERNAYGTQNESFEKEIDFMPSGEKVDAFFIRAPKIISIGKDVEVLASIEDDPVGIRSLNSLGMTCHPEVANNDLFHRFFVEEIIQGVKSKTP